MSGAAGDSQADAAAGSRVDPRDIPTGGEPSDEQKQVATFFRELQTGQLDFLDQAGKRVIELCTALLALLFGLLAFGDKFPPAYVAGYSGVKWMLIGALIAYMMAMVMAAWGIHPQAYDHYPNNITAAREELAKIVAFKAVWVQAAGVLFVLGSLLLTVTAGALVLAA